MKGQRSDVFSCIIMTYEASKFKLFNYISGFLARGAIRIIVLTMPQTQMVRYLCFPENEGKSCVQSRFGIELKIEFLALQSDKSRPLYPYPNQI